jgi:hypothetical protein
MHFAPDMCSEYASRRYAKKGLKRRSCMSMSNAVLLPRVMEGIWNVTGVRSGSLSIGLLAPETVPDCQF